MFTLVTKNNTEFYMVLLAKNFILFFVRNMLSRSIINLILTVTIFYIPFNLVFCGLIQVERNERVWVYENRELSEFLDFHTTDSIPQG